MKFLPIESLNIFSHPGVSASVLLGTAGSIYLLLQSVKLVSKRNPKRNFKVIANKFCAICETKVENLVEVVTCKGCSQYICQNQKCSDYNLELETWECVSCKKNRVIQQKTGEFFLRHINELEDQTLANLVRDTINKWNDGQGVAIEITKTQLHTISKFVEQILIKNIESALSIESSSDHNHQLLTAANATSSSDYYTDLERFITHICEEVMKITNAIDISGMPPREQKNSENNDQQSLSETVQSPSIELEQQQDKISVSMAIADKKIKVESATAITNSCKVDDNKNHISFSNDIEGIQAECEKCKERNVDSLIFERLNSRYDDDMQHLSDCVENRSVALPDLSNDSDLLIRKDYDLDATNFIPEMNWEDNWQLREILRNNTHGISMLIPSPTQEVRAQIGDRSADEYDSDLSENEIEFDEENSDIEISQNFCYSTTLHIMTKSPIATTKTIPIETKIIESNNEESTFTSMIDIVSPEPSSLKQELKGDKNEMDIKFALITSPSPPVTIESESIVVDDEELFDSIVETSSINDHKKSIDEAFESILKSEEKISKGILETTEALKREEEAARRVHEALENLLRDEEQATWRIHEAVNISAAKIREENLRPVEKIHEAINGTIEEDPHIKYRKVEVDVDNRTRYSPLFKNYNFSPIKPVKVIENSSAPQSAPITANIFDPFPCHTFTNNHQSISRPKSIASIPEDDSISNLLHTASLISQSRGDLSFNSDDVLINKDPERVLMDNLVPGSIAEREHNKWMHAAPIANNPYSPDALERRLSETHSRQKVMDIHALLQQHEPPLVEDKNDEVVQAQQRPNSIRYKRDYYINDDKEDKNHHQNSPSPITTVTATSSPKHITLDVNNDEIIKPKKKAYEEMSVSMLIEDMEMPLKYTRHDQDYSLTALNSLTMSEDSETTRIYTPSTQEMKLIAQHAERISTTKGFPVATVPLDEYEIGKFDDGSIKGEIVHEDVYEERQVIEPEVLEHLPSVRKLAELYKQEGSSEISNSTNNNTVKSQISRNGLTNSIHNYPMPIASITARTLPAQVRADLKQSFANEDQDSCARYDDPEPSPDIQPGMTKSSIAFFENLMR